MSRSRDSAKAEREALKERTRALRSERLLEDSTRLASMGQEDADRIKLTGYSGSDIGSPRYVVARWWTSLSWGTGCPRGVTELVYTDVQCPVFARDKAYRIQNFTTCGRQASDCAVCRP